MAKQYLDLHGLQTFKTGIEGWVGDQIETLDGSATIASVSNDIVTLKAGITEADGIVDNSSGSDITLAKAAKTGAAADISITDTDGNFTSTDVEGALAELAEASSGGVASKTVYLVDETSGQSAYAKVYTFYQGSDSSDMTKNTNLGSINIAKDKVVSGGAVVNITYNSEDGKLYDGATDVTALIKGSGTASASDAGKYIKLQLQNVTDPLYIAAQDLVDIYTAEQNASQIQLVISNSNVISATIVAGSVDTTELANSAVTTAKIADDAVTADKIAISAHTEAQTAGTDGLAISVTTTDGQISSVSGSIAENTYDAYGSASSALSTAEGYTDTAIAALDAVADSTKTAIDGNTARTAENGGVFALQAITETDGKITAMTAVEVEAAGTTATAIAALDADVDASGTAQHSGTFVVSGITEVDGVITAVDSVEVENAGAAAAVVGTGTGRTGSGTELDPYVYADTIKGVKTLIADTDANIESIPDASIEALFS